MTPTAAPEITLQDANLAKLAMEPGTMIPTFYEPRKNYVVNVASTASAVRITATAKHPQAVVRLEGKVVPPEQAVELAVKPGLNVFPLEVTAADGVTKEIVECKAVRAIPSLNWERVLEHAPLAARDSSAELVFQNRMWVIGGYLPHLTGDVWSSPDGVHWEEMGQLPDADSVNIPVQFAHAGRMWVSAQSGRFYSSADGRKWDVVAERTPFSGRYAAGSAVFAGRMWVLGGQDKTLHNDVWSSADGVNWREETAHARWSPRQLFGNVVVHNGLLWVIGGGITSYQPFRGYRDVWCSSDGKEWRQVTDEAPWPARIWSSCASYGNRLFLLTGFRAQPTWSNLDDVWYSADGATWRQLICEDGFSARHEVSVMVFQDALWTVAGNAWPLVNDVWRLKISGLCFLSQPIVEEYVTAQYRYRAVADFHASGGALRYRLLTAPPWLGIDMQTGLVHGRPPQTGTYPVAIEATDAAGEKAIQQYDLRVF